MDFDFGLSRTNRKHFNSSSMPGCLIVFQSLSEYRRKNKSSIHFFIKNIGILNMILGLMLGAYTGVLLSSMGSRPLWNTSLLWVLFLVSGLSAAAAFVHLFAKNKLKVNYWQKLTTDFLLLNFSFL